MGGAVHGVGTRQACRAVALGPVPDLLISGAVGATDAWWFEVGYDTCRWRPLGHCDGNLLDDFFPFKHSVAFIYDAWTVAFYGA